MNTDVHETATELEPAETELYSDEIRQLHVLENRDTSERLGVAKDPHLSLELQSLAQLTLLHT